MKQELDSLLNELKFKSREERRKIIELKAIKIRVFKGEVWTCPFNGFYKVNDCRASWYDQGDKVKILI